MEKEARMEALVRAIDLLNGEGTEAAIAELEALEAKYPRVVDLAAMSILVGISKEEVIEIGKGLDD